MKAGDRVSEGSVVVVLDGVAAAAPGVPAAAPSPPPAEAAPAPAAVAPPAPPPSLAGTATVAARALAAPAEGAEGRLPHASPTIRRLARELGVELARVEGTGPKGRILKEDLGGS